MLELLSPAGSPEAVVAAVQSGADAIYMGFGGFNARRGAKNFTDEEFDSAVRYCRVRGCKVYVTLNTLVSDREVTEAVKLACHAAEIGVDAIIVQDLGFARVLRCVLPDMPLHASTQMSIHNLAGVEAAAEMGISRAVLARELSFEQISMIAEKSPIELEVFAHGALCFCHSGQCYMSALIGRRSGNRGACAQPCRLQYSLGGRMDNYPLSLKDNCLVAHLKELEKAGVACVKIEGRMKRPEYSAIVTKIYSRAIHDGAEPSELEMQQLETAFSRQGFTEGYFDGKKGAHMFGVRGEPDRDVNKLYNSARKEYAHSELRRVPIKFFSMIKAGEKSRFAVEDQQGNKVIKEGPVPQKAENQALTQKGIYDQFYKTGGTPFLCSDVSAVVDEGLFMPSSVLNEMRRSLLEALSEERKRPPVRKVGKMPKTPVDVKVLGEPKLIMQISSADQLTEELAEFSPDYIYVPLEILINNPAAVLPFAKKGAVPVAVLPRVITDDQMPEIIAMLSRASAMGVTQALIGNMGHIRFTRLSGFDLRGDFGLNVYNSDTLQVLNAAGFLSATASFELRLSQIRDMQKPINTEIIAYGRLPLMVSDQCIIKNSAGQCNCQNPVSLSDRTGQIFPVMREFGCRNVIFNAHKLFLADKQEDYGDIGVWGIRLIFTNEGAKECVRIAESYTGKTDYVPNGLTRGLYYRGVE
ncbi:MAG: U32 family peptidase [Clostridiales bacterium]|jgi:putative protease|nr:U32 family peptidase [Clostridiales bacterium]